MDSNVLVALITGGSTLAGVIATVIWGNKKTLAVVETKLEQLSQSVNRHNDFASRIPVLEKEVEFLTGEAKTLREENAELKSQIRDLLMKRG